jgi:hypothetical protein
VSPFILKMFDKEATINKSTQTTMKTSGILQEGSQIYQDEKKRKQNIVEDEDASIQEEGPSAISSTEKLENVSKKLKSGSEIEISELETKDIRLLNETNMPPHEHESRSISSTQESWFTTINVLERNISLSNWSQTSTCVEPSQQVAQPDDYSSEDQGENEYTWGYTQKSEK